MRDVALVVPSIRPESLLLFLGAWKDYLYQARDSVFLVLFETHGPSVNVSEVLPGIEYLHLTQKDVVDRWGSWEWVLPQTNSSCRCFAMWEAYCLGAKIVISMDDDAYPLPEVSVDSFLHGHSDALTTMTTLDWWKTTQFETRGFPYRVRGTSRVVVNQGLWTGVPDNDAPTQLLHPEYRCAIAPRQLVPRWNYFPMSWMNVAIHRDVMPLLAPPPSIMHKPTDRFDDTWTGICIKRGLDILGLAATYGPPYVEHQRATSPYENLRREAMGMEEHEEFWRWVDLSPTPFSTGNLKEDVTRVSASLAGHLSGSQDKYVRKYGEARWFWLDKFTECSND